MKPKLLIILFTVLIGSNIFQFFYFKNAIKVLDIKERQNYKEVQTAYKAIGEFYEEYRKAGYITVSNLIETIERQASMLETLDSNVDVANENQKLNDNRIDDLYSKYDYIIRILRML